MVVCNIKSTYTQVLALLCLMESGIYSLFGTLVVHWRVLSMIFISIPGLKTGLLYWICLFISFFDLPFHFLCCSVLMCVLNFQGQEFLTPTICGERNGCIFFWNSVIHWEAKSWTFEQWRILSWRLMFLSARDGVCNAGWNHRFVGFLSERVSVCKCGNLLDNQEWMESVMKIQEVGYILFNFFCLRINLTFQSYTKVQES